MRHPHALKAERLDAVIKALRRETILNPPGESFAIRARRRLAQRILEIAKGESNE